MGMTKLPKDFADDFTEDAAAELVKADEEWAKFTKAYVPPEYGPKYPALGEKVAKFRRKANMAGGAQKLPKAERVAYGEAVLEAIRGLQRSELMRCLRPTPSDKAYADDWKRGEAILASIRAGLRAQTCPRRVPATWGEYEDAMKAKRKALALQEAA
jgi:hypothetical protein